MLKYGLTTLSLALSCFSLQTMAETKSLPYHLIAPTCLLKNITTKYEALAKTPAFAFVTVNEEGFNQFVEAKHQHIANCGGFMNVTDAWNKYNAKPLAVHDAKSFLSSYTLPIKKTGKLAEENYTVKYQHEVSALLNQFNPEAMWGDLTALTNFKDRFANSDNGVAAANWIKTQIETLASQYGRKDVSYTFVPTGSRYKQPSLVIKVGASNDPGIVVGGHMDTLNSTFELKPGADDDGTGTVTVLAVARTLFASGMQFKKPIYFIWYSAEEMGLVGSQYVVADFKQKNIPVAAVIQLDMTGYAYKNEPTMWLMNDNVDANLTAFLETLITTYVKQPVKHSSCGYACSDHATWTKNGFVAATPFESSMDHDNPAIHTSRDTMEKLSLSHMTDYAKLAIAYMVELAEPVKG